MNSLKGLLLMDAQNYDTQITQHYTLFGMALADLQHRCAMLCCSAAASKNVSEHLSADPAGMPCCVRSYLTYADSVDT